MQDIRAWRRAGDGNSEASGTPFSGLSASPLRRSSGGTPVGFNEGSLGPARLSDLFSQAGRLDFSERLEDGFRDVGCCPASGVSTPAESSSLASSAVVLVDRREDEFLMEFVDRVSKKIQRASDVVTRVMVASLLVSEALGRSGIHAANLQARYERLVLKRANPSTGVVKLGDILHDLDAPGGSKARQPGAGTSRHRTLLFKALADWLQIAPCGLHREEQGATWNVLLVEGEPFVLDVMFDPGALYTQGSGRASEYLRRLQLEKDSLNLSDRNSF